MPDESPVDIVWAEDSAGDRFLIQSILDEVKPPIRVAFATDGVAALELVARHRPRLVVLDERMPHANGVRVLERIRADAALTGARIAMFSASARPSEIGRARALGALGFFQKPLDFGPFRQVVATLVAEARREEGAPSLLSFAGQHHVLFWDSENDLIESVTRFLGEGDQRGDGLIAMATPDHIAKLRGAIAGRDAVWLDTTEVYKAIRSAGRPDPDRFATLFGQAMETASLGGKRPVTCFGELVAVLRTQGEGPAALAIEAIGQTAAVQNPASLSILCAYPTAAFTQGEELDATCLVHASHSFSSGTYVSPQLST